jgi:hypothetical protein
MAPFCEGASRFSNVKEPAVAAGWEHYTPDGRQGIPLARRCARFGSSLRQIFPRLWRCRNNKQKIAGFPLKGFGV